MKLTVCLFMAVISSTPAVAQTSAGQKISLVQYIQASHAADGMFAACAKAKGVSNPVQDVEKKLSSKADIVKALKDAIAFCADAFSALTEQRLEEYVRQGPVEIPRSAALIGVLAHNAEMYGISTVYLRAKNLVPPASERR